MSISVTCVCGRRYDLNNDLAGKRIRCRHCSATIDVPAVDDEPVEEEDEPVETTAPLARQVFTPASPAVQSTYAQRQAARAQRRRDEGARETRDRLPWYYGFMYLNAICCFILAFVVIVLGFNEVMVLMSRPDATDSLLFQALQRNGSNLFSSSAVGAFILMVRDGCIASRSRANGEASA